MSPLAHTATVTFQSAAPGVPPLTTTKVAIIPLKQQTGGEDTLYEVFYDPDLAYPDGTPIRVADRIYWDQLSTRFAVLRQPVQLRGLTSVVSTQFLDLALPTPITNARTGATNPGRVDKSSSSERLEGLPPEVVIRKWTITQPFDVTDILVSDTLSAAGLGTYRVLTKDIPRSLQESSQVTTIRVDQGAYELPMDPNAHLLFYRNAPYYQEVGPVPVYVEQLPSDGVAGPAAVKYPYILHVPAGVVFPAVPPAYPNPAPISAYDLVKWDELPDGMATIHEPRHIYGPLERLILHLNKAS